RSELTLNLRFK
ncbi:hypothetical protein D047_4102B, partial [Vibrio parahaemolyticus VPTS-2010_2]